MRKRRMRPKIYAKCRSKESLPLEAKSFGGRHNPSNIFFRRSGAFGFAPFEQQTNTAEGENAQGAWLRGYRP